MNTLMKVGIGLTALAGAVGAAHFVRAADPVPAAAAQAAIKIPPNLEAHLRAMARAHAGDINATPEQAEAHLMKMLDEHLAQVAKDPALTAQVNQMMAKAEAGDEGALEHIHAALGQLLHGGH